MLPLPVCTEVNRLQSLYKEDMLQTIANLGDCPEKTRVMATGLN